MSSIRKYIGIDISKDYFDVAIDRENGEYKSYQFTNDLKGFSTFLKVVAQPSWCVMEASGPYYLKLATFLKDHHIKVSVVNPLVIRRFCQMKLMRAKTDKKDAIMIAEYGRINCPEEWIGEESYVLELKQLQNI